MIPGSSAYISIGRNVGNEPMPLKDWGDFKRDIAILANAFGIVVSDADGRGLYDGDYEDTYIVVVQLWENVELQEIRRELSSIAQRYRQESIALAIARVEFVEAANLV